MGPINVLLAFTALGLTPALVRRARKDLETRPPTLVGERNESLELEVEGCTVLLSERPSEARCSCPSKGSCRHILCAIMFVAAAAPSPSDAPADPDAELSTLEEDAIRKWAGKALFDRAEREFEHHDLPSVALNTWRKFLANVEGPPRDDAAMPPLILARCNNREIIPGSRLGRGGQGVFVEL